MEPIGAPLRHRRVLPYVLVGAGFTLLGGGIAGYFRLPAYAKQTAEARALEQGVELHAEAADVGFGWVRLRGVTFSPVGVTGVRGTSDRVTVELNGLTPTRVTTRSAALEIEGPVSAVVGQLDAWSKRFPAAARPPLAADGIALAWREAAGATPWLDVADASAQTDAGAGTFYAPKSTLFGVSAGELALTWAAGRNDVLVGLGNRDPNQAPLRLEATSGTPLKGRLHIARTPLPSLGALLGVAINEPDVSAEATLGLTLSPGAPLDLIEGHADVALHGYVPPHPRELQGIVYGKTTKLGTNFRVAADRRSAALTNTTLQAGGLSLRGAGSIERHDPGARAKLDMRGQVPCGALARSAVTANLGDNLLGDIVGGLAGATLRGALTVNVHIEADTKDLDRARVTPVVSGDCGLGF